MTGLPLAADSPRRTARVAAAQSDRILPGAVPAEGPGRQPSEFELITDLTIAGAPGPTAAWSILGRAVKLIE